MKYNGNDIFAPFNAGLYGIDDGGGDCALQWQESKDAILDAFEEEFETQIIAKLEAAGMKYIGLEYYSPRFYNFETDSIDLELEIVDTEKCLDAIRKNADAIVKGLDANKSYDGYMAKTAESITEVCEEVERGDLDVIALRAILSGIDFSDFAEDGIYENLVYDYACETCGRIHSEHDNEDDENKKIIDDCIKNTTV